MENLDKYQELLTRYLTGELSASEITEIEQWLNSDPAHMKYYNEFRYTWYSAGAPHISRNVDVEEEWELFQQAIQANKPAENVPLSVSENKNGRYKKLLVVSGVAASLLLVISLAWKGITVKKSQPTTAITSPSTQGFISMQIKNIRERDTTISFSDGSVVTLAANSEIGYREPFQQDRNIVLNGKASFKVAKGIPKKFVVRTGSITTTALGTAFMIDYNKSEQSFIIRLYESKVVVEEPGKADSKIKEAIYLEPGQELIYNAQGATVKSITNAGNTKAVCEFDGTYYHFTNQPLEGVFNNLSATFGIHIDYNQVQLKDIYFTGKYNKTDAIEKILARIAAANNLSITKTDSGFIVTN
ncbi:FecR family protein [Chitinophaga jiangningensis]|uniref:FecR family protein n=1 Tax=Chitinophaga jiangningensis TaxID=1419482 RepID=A0A1M7C482_9BACT|nr:FecR family protein [Chitinophaga jiangningensis]SHL61649.1 FecR family protein [Chitinophaga jiangningensis]